MGRLSRKVIVNSLDFYSFIMHTLYQTNKRGYKYKLRKGPIVHDAHLNIME